MCGRVSTSIQPNPKTKLTGQMGAQPQGVGSAHSASYFEAAGCQSSREKNRAGLKGAAVLDFFCIQWFDTAVREPKAVNVCLGSCKTAFGGFINLLTKVKYKIN